MKPEKTTRENIIEILHTTAESMYPTKGTSVIASNTKIPNLFKEGPEILPLIGSFLIEELPQLLAEDNDSAKNNLSTFLQCYFKESAKYQPQKMSSVLLALSDIVQKEALGAIYRLWGPLNINGFDENGKKVMDKELWLTWLQLAEKQESLEWGIQYMKDEIEKGLLLLTPSS